MSATPTTTTYRAPDGQIIRDVQFDAETNCYKWKDDQGDLCTAKAVWFEQRFTPVLDEKGRQMTENLTFGQALKALKRGERVARAGWNGKGMFIYYVPANAYPAQTGVAKAYFGEDAKVPYAAYLAIKNVNETVSTWAPSISDCLSEDWCILPTA